MKQINTALFVLVSNALSRISMGASVVETPGFDQRARDLILKGMNSSLNEAKNYDTFFAAIEADCLALGFPASLASAKRMRSASSQGIDVVTVGNLSEEFIGRLVDEMEARLFWSMSAEESDLYKNPRKDWDGVPERFNRAASDIEECTFCLVFGRFTAAVFHSMRVAEVGAIEIGKLIDLKDPKPGWSAVIRELRRVCHREKFDKLTPLEQQHRNFLNEWLPLLESVNSSWRDRVSHVENRLVLDKDVDERIARDIVGATQSFMRRLAMDLPKSNSDGDVL